MAVQGEVPAILALLCIPSIPAHLKRCSHCVAGLQIHGNPKSSGGRVVFLAQLGIAPSTAPGDLVAAPRLEISSNRTAEHASKSYLVWTCLMEATMLSCMNWACNSPEVQWFHASLYETKKAGPVMPQSLTGRGNVHYWEADA